MSGSSPTAASPTPASADATAVAVAVAVSGGADSMALLWVTWAQASALGLKTWAFHVHHGLQSQADAWPQFVEQECGRWSRLRPEWPPIECAVRRLAGRPTRGQSVEEWARDGRRTALLQMAQAQGVTLVLLAHHRQDQAETFLLQALRGAGPQGLAGMPRLQWRGGVCLARPWLAQPRAVVRAVAAAAGLDAVEDPSNADPRWARNRLRLAVWPALTQAFEQAEAALAVAASRCAQALESMEQGARADWTRCVREVVDEDRSIQLDLSEWQALNPARRSLVLRLWWADLGLEVPAAAVDRIAHQSLSAGTPLRWPLRGPHELHWYRGRLRVGVRPASTDPGGRSEPAGTRPIEAAPMPQALRFTRAARRCLPVWGGALVLRRAQPGEPAFAGPLPLSLWVRAREPGDRFQRSPHGLARSLKKQFQAGAVPSWARTGPVVTDAQGEIWLVPGLGMDARVVVPGGRWVLEWVPDTA